MFNVCGADAVRIGPKHVTYKSILEIFQLTVSKP